MPRPVVTETRRRFLAAYERGDGTVAELSRRFGFSEATGKRLLRRWRERGDVAPLAPRGGHEPELYGARLAAFLVVVDANPDATQKELAALWKLATGVTISRTTVQRALAAAGARAIAVRRPGPRELAEPLRQLRAEGAKEDAGSIAADATEQHRGQPALAVARRRRRCDLDALVESERFRGEERGA